MKKLFLIEVICALLILLFMYTGLSKLSNHVAFVMAMNKSFLLRGNSQWISWVIPIIELIVSLLLCFSNTRLGGLIASASLMALFSAYVTTILIHAKDIPCTCGGVLQQMSWHTHLVFNISMLAISIIGLSMEKKRTRNAGGEREQPKTNSAFS